MVEAQNLMLLKNTAMKWNFQKIQNQSLTRAASSIWVSTQTITSRTCK